MSSFIRKVKEAVKWIKKINPLWAFLFTVVLFVLANFLSNYIPTDSNNVFLAAVKNSDPKFRKLAELAGFQKSELRTKDDEIVYATTLSRNPHTYCDL